MLVGFVGVLIALGPSAGSLGTGSLIALAGSFIYALSLVLTRKVKETPNAVLATTQSLGSLAFGAIAAPLTWVAGRERHALPFASRSRRGVDRGDRLRQPLAPARAGVGRCPLPIHA